MTDELHPEVKAYLRSIASKGGKAAAPLMNAKLTTAKRRKMGQKAAKNLTPEERSARAALASAARWKPKGKKENV